MLKWKLKKSESIKEVIEDDTDVKEDNDSKEGYHCRYCENPIMEEYVIIGKKIFHPQCLRCSICGVVIDEDYFLDQDNNIICPKDKVRTGFGIFKVQFD